MADKRIIDLTETSSLSSSDFLMTDNASTGSKKISYSNLLGSELNILGAEVQSLDGRMDTAEVDIDNLETAVSAAQGNISALQTAVANKQDALTFDNAPTSGSSNPVKSGGVYSALTNKVDTTTFDDAITTINNSIDTIETGYNPDMKAGYVMGSEPMQTDIAPYLMKVSPYNRLDLSLTGGTVAVNQLVGNGDFSNGATGWGTSSAGVTPSVSDNTMTVTVTDNTKPGRPGLAKPSMTAPIIGHKYLFLCDFRATTNMGSDLSVALLYGNRFTWSNSTTKNAWVKMAVVGSVTALTYTTLDVYVSNTVTQFSNGDKLEYKNVQVIDLTQMFGSTIADYVYSLETQTAGSGVAWLRSYGFFTEDFYPFDSGSLLSVKTSAHKTVGKNLFDETQYYDLASDYDYSDGSYRCKRIQLLPNTQYTVTSFGGVASTTPIMLLNRVQQVNASGFFDFRKDTDTKTYTTDASGCLYVGVIYYATDAQIEERLQACKVQIEYGSTATPYVPYTAHTYPLSDIELRGIPKLVDNKLQYDGDRYESSGQVTRKWKVADLGSFNWDADANRACVFYVAVSDKQSGQSGNTSVNGLVCAKYAYRNAGVSTSVDNYISDFPSYGGKAIYVRDTAYASVSDFKTAMNGVMFAYQLATPTTETADAFENPQITTKNGTEEFIDERTVPMPVGNTSTYYWDMTATDIINYIEELTQPDHDMIADSNIASGKYFMVGNTLYLSTAAIAQGAQIIVGTNCTEVSLAEALNTINA